MSAGKPVIVSDEQLLGRLTREHRLGLVFPSGNVSALAQSLRQITQLSAADVNQFAATARNYAKTYSRDAFRTALLRSLSTG
jgi:glycosyltransferase involved in cell wall biosynthesis